MQCLGQTCQLPWRKLQHARGTAAIRNCLPGEAAMTQMLPCAAHGKQQCKAEQTTCPGTCFIVLEGRSNDWSGSSSAC